MENINPLDLLCEQCGRKLTLISCSEPDRISPITGYAKCHDCNIYYKFASTNSSRQLVRRSESETKPPPEIKTMSPEEYVAMRENTPAVILISWAQANMITKDLAQHHVNKEEFFGCYRFEYGDKPYKQEISIEKVLNNPYFKFIKINEEMTPCCYRCKFLKSNTVTYPTYDKRDEGWGVEYHCEKNSELICDPNNQKCGNFKETKR